MREPTAVVLLVTLMATVAALYLGHVTGKAWRAYRARFQITAAHNLSELFLFLDTRQLFRLNLVLLLIAFGIALACGVGVVLSVMTSLGLAISPPAIYATLRRRRLRAAVSQLPDALLSVSTHLRSGLSMSQALESVIAYQPPPLGQELGLVLRELRMGMPHAEALDNLHRRLPEVDVQLITAAMKLSREIGGNLAETLERISDTLRRRLQMEGKIRSLTAQGQIQGLVMTGLPVFLVVALNLMEPRAMHYLFDAWYGWATIGFIALLELTGFHFIQKIVRIDV